MPWCSTQTLPKRSLLSKHHTVSWYTCNCKFISSHTSRMNFLHPFSQTPHINTAALCADVYTIIHPCRTINSDVTDRHSHRSWIKVWQAVNRFTRHSFQSTILCECLLCQTLSKSEENARNAGTYAFRCLSKICFRQTGSQNTHKCPSELSGDLLHWI